MKWWVFSFGVVLSLAPFVLGYSGTPAALWPSLILGLAIAILALLRTPYLLQAVVGLAAFVSPWVFGFSSIGGATWSHLILGALVTVLTGYRTVTQRGESATTGSA